MTTAEQVHTKRLRQMKREEWGKISSKNSFISSDKAKTLGDE